MTRVWINGVYDAGLHHGHIELIKYAHSLGDMVVAGIDSNSRVSFNKGVERPLWDEKKRAKSLLDTGLIADVKIFKTDRELERLIKEYKPDIFVIGSDYRGKKIIGAKYAKEVVFFERIDGYSTTEILEKEKETPNNVRG